MTRYLSGLCVAGLGLCGGGWLVVAAVAFGGESAGRAGRVNLLTGAVLIAVCCLSLVCWSRLWRQRLRADGVLADPFPLVSRREARRNRRALSRDVRRAAKLAERSARGARRAARRSARLASGGALSEGGVLGEGVALGVASADDEQYGRAAASYGTGLDGAAATGADLGGVSGHDAHGKGGSDPGVGGAGANPGERAAELISELRSMLEPMLAATGGRPATTATSAPAASPLPQRSRFASELRPRMTAADMAMPRSRSAPMSIPRLAPAADDSALGPALGPASDDEDSWW
jgi:hypothetical protein